MEVSYSEVKSSSSVLEIFRGGRVLGTLFDRLLEEEREEERGGFFEVGEQPWEVGEESISSFSSFSSFSKVRIEVTIKP